MSLAPGMAQTPDPPRAAGPVHPVFRRSLAQRIRERLQRSFDLRLVRWMGLGDTQQVWYLRQLLPLLGIDLVVDVGANHGQFATLLRQRVGYRGALISVEPMPEAAAALRQRFAGDSRFALAECALSDHAGSGRLQVLQGHEMSSLLQPSSQATDRYTAFQQVTRTAEVALQTLDQLLATQPLAQGARHVYLKMDVQGLEGAVLRGAAQSLDRIDALQAEASVIALYEGQQPYHALMRDIEALGYQLSFLPAHNYTQLPDMVDFDCHFVSRRRLQQLGYLRAAASAAG